MLSEVFRVYIWLGVNLIALRQFGNRRLLPQRLQGYPHLRCRIDLASPSLVKARVGKLCIMTEIPARPRADRTGRSCTPGRG